MLRNDRTGEFSSSRAVMLGSFVLSVLMYAWVAVLVTHCYYTYGPVMLDHLNLSWYLYGGTGSLVTGISAYGLNKYGDRNLEPLGLEGMESPEENEEEVCQTN